MTLGTVKVPFSAIQDDIQAVSFDIKGNYGVSIIWSDGHYADIYAFDILKKIAIEISMQGK